MTEILIHIDHLVLRDVPAAWAEDLGPQLERAVAAAARADAEGQAGPERRAPASDRDAFAHDVGRQIWISVRGDVR